MTPLTRSGRSHDWAPAMPSAACVDTSACIQRFRPLHHPPLPVL